MPKPGKQAWRFYTVPGDPKKGYESKRTGGSREDVDRHRLVSKIPGGGTVWTRWRTMPRADLLAASGRATAQKPWNGSTYGRAASDNLHPVIDSGGEARYRQAWHGITRETPGESWDYTRFNPSCWRI